MTKVGKKMYEKKVYYMNKIDWKISNSHMTEIFAIILEIKSVMSSFVKHWFI